MSSNDSLKVVEQTSRLLDYLSAVARHLYINPVRDIREYEPLITPSMIPNQSKIHLGPTATNDSWLSLPRLIEPELPPLPLELEGLVDPDSMDNLEGEPHFVEDLGEPDFGSVELLESWIQSSWLPWALKTQPIREARKLYDRLFLLHLRAQRDQATHEIVWGHSILSWAGPRVVVSPVLITKVTIEIDDNGEIRVNRDSLSELEIDPLEGLSVDGLEELARLRARIMESSIDAWSKEALYEMRHQFVAPLGLHASSNDSDDFPSPDREIRLHGGWALYLRKRPIRHDRFYSELADVLRSGEFLPESMASIVADEKRLGNALQELELDGDQDWSATAARLLMPLPTNIDQERIATQLSAARGVTVQGPPGTGKSHTIVNLVSHLIAHGKRVLVTAQNEQALSVLRNKFPVELRDLTVSVLGSTPAAMDELHSSVQVVMDIASQTDIQSESAKIESLGLQIDAERENLRRSELRIIDALRDETREFHLGNESVKAPDLAKWLALNESSLGLIPDQISDTTELPLTDMELSDLYRLIQKLNSEDVQSYQLIRPRAAQLPTSVELRESIERIDQIQLAVTDLEESGLEIESVDKTPVQELSEIAARVSLAADRLELISTPWLLKTREILNSSPTVIKFWREQVDTLTQQNRTCEEYRRRILGHQTQIPIGDPRIQLELLDELGERFKYGKSVPRLGNKPLRELHEGIKLDGYPVRTTQEVKRIKDSIRLKSDQRAMQLRIQQLSLDNGMPIPDLDSSFNMEVEALLGQLKNALEWESNFKAQLNIELTPFFGTQFVAQNAEALRSAAQTLKNAATRHEERQLSKKNSELLEHLKYQSSIQNASPMWIQLAEALVARDWGRWRAVLEDSERLSALGAEIDNLLSMKSKLEVVSPKWMQMLLEHRANPDKCGEPEQLKQYWLWSQAEFWLRGIHGKNDLWKLMETASAQQAEIARLVLDLAARSAAVGVKQNMEDSKRRALQSWLQALKKRGKGTGKYAPHWENVARKELPVAMGAIPVWIMPIHRVIENFDPTRSQLFDVVIVDESSQCDLLSVGVLALGAKAIVVGDDKQTSPAAVGIDQEEIIKLQEMYIGDIDGKSLLTVTESLYGIAERVFSNVILLKEHFRCLPEIINFSNRYYDNRILPLREKPDREIGAILNAVHVLDGACTGNGSNRINKAEANALVSQIVKCCNDPAYDGLSFGVVTMLGNGQGPYIENLLFQTIGIEEYQRRKIRVGNAPVFQGDERSVIFISMVADDNSYAATRAQDKQRINVAASRAQDQLWVFYSVDPTTLNANDERRALIQYVQNFDLEEKSNSDLFELCESEFERRVLADVLDRGYRVKPQHPVGRYRIDMVVHGSKNRIAVECDGDSFHGPDQWEQDIQRQRVLERLGWNFWRVRASEYWRDPGKALVPLWEKLGEPERSEISQFQEFSSVDSNSDVITMSTDADSAQAMPLEPNANLGDIEAQRPHQPPLAAEPDTHISIWTDFIGLEPNVTYADDLGGMWFDLESGIEVTGTPMASQGRVEDTPGLKSISKVSYRFTLLTLSFTFWESKLSQVDCISADAAGEQVKRLLHGGRLGVYQTDDESFHYAETRIMKPGSGAFSSAQNPSPGELEEIIGWSLEKYLTNLEGFECVSTREKFLGDRGPRRSTPIAVWRGADSKIPIVIYTATRFLPLLKLDGEL